MGKSRRGPDPEDRRERDPRPPERGGQRNLIREYLEEEGEDDLASGHWTYGPPKETDEN